MDETIKRKILALLDQHRVMTIATLRPDGWPQATTVGSIVLPAELPATGSRVPLFGFLGALTLAAAAAVDTINDAIFIESGTYTCGIALTNGERVVGKGASATLDSILVIAPVAGSAFPSTAGARPSLNVGTGTCLTLGISNLLRSIDIGNADVDIAGTAYGTLTASQMALSGTGQALNLDNGTLAATFDSIASTSSAAQNLRLNQAAGSMVVTGTTTLSGATGTALDVQNGAATVTFTGAATVTKSAAGAGVNINAHSGLVSFSQLNVTTTNGAALTADTANVDVNAGTLSATGGPGVNSTGTNWNTTTLTSVSSSGSGTQGINLNNISGTLAMNGGSLATSAGTAFFGQANLGTTSYAGSVSKTSAGKAVVVSGAGAGTLTLSGSITCNGGCTGLDVLNRTGGSNTFSGASKVLNTGASAGVTLTTNTGATIDFTGGGLDIDTTSGTGFNATGGGSISVQGTVNTIRAWLKPTPSHSREQQAGEQGLAADGRRDGDAAAKTGPCAIAQVVAAGKHRRVVGGDNGDGRGRGIAVIGPIVAHDGHRAGGGVRHCAHRAGAGRAGRAGLLGGRCARARAMGACHRAGVPHSIFGAGGMDQPVRRPARARRDPSRAGPVFVGRAGGELGG